MKLITQYTLSLTEVPVSLPPVHSDGYGHDLAVIIQSSSGHVNYGGSTTQLLSIAAGGTLTVPEVRSENVYLSSTDNGVATITIFGD